MEQSISCLYFINWPFSDFFIKSLVKYTKEKNKMTGLFHDPYLFPLKDSGR